MPVTDRRSSGVYVTIEDASYVAPTTEVGRSVLCVGICEKGRHNRIVKKTSLSSFQKEFGKPDFHTTSQSHYIMDKAMQYSGEGYFIRVVPEDAKIANAYIEEVSSPVSTVGTASEFIFTENSTSVEVDNSVFDDFTEGDWIFCNDGLDGITEARQIITKDLATLTYTLDSAYTGSTTGWGTKSDTASKYVPFISTNKTLDWDVNFKSEADVDPEVVYAFYATGAGSKYYNKLKIKGSRNAELERQYTDEDGVTKYKYLFCDIGIYREKDDGSGDILLEGPWTVSLSERTPEGNIIRDITSGKVLYIQEVINERSEIVKMIAGTAVSKLSLPDNPSNNIISEKNRLMITLLMSAAQPIGTLNYVPRGNSLNFANGDDGTSDGNPLYDSSGNLQLGDEIYGLCKQAYQGFLTSVDGSIEKINEVIRPLFEFDYIISGGFPSTVQDGARQLADYRQDCHHIGDTGFNYSASTDITTREQNVPWLLF